MVPKSGPKIQASPIDLTLGPTLGATLGNTLGRGSPKSALPPPAKGIVQSLNESDQAISSIPKIVVFKAASATEGDHENATRCRKPNPHPLAQAKPGTSLNGKRILAGCCVLVSRIRMWGWP